MLDTAHLGDIEGAFGRISVGETDHPRTFKTRLLTLLAIVGPGIIVMVGDNDAGGVATYAQAGQNYGYSLLWVLLLLIPVLIVNQEMVVRLGAVTGVGHARLINERFGRGWGWFSVGDLFLLNFLTIVTEFIGITLAADYIGVSKYLVVPASAVALVAIMATGSFRRWERAMFVFIAVTLVQIPMLLMSHPQWGHAAKSFVVPSISGGVSSDAVLLIIAIVGTTVAPWQLFFQQSNVVDKRITPRFIGYERADTVLGAFVVVVGAAALLMTGDWAARSTNNVEASPTPATSPTCSANTAQPRLAFRHRADGRLDHRRRRGHPGDQLRLRRCVRSEALAAPRFRRRQTVLPVLHRNGGPGRGDRADPGRSARADHHRGAGPRRPAAAQRQRLPAAAVQRPGSVGPLGQSAWLNWLAGLIVGILLLLSGILMATTLFPDLNVVAVAATWRWPSSYWPPPRSSAALDGRRQPAPPAAKPPARAVDRNTWRMPPLTLLEPVTWSPGTRLGMIALRGYLVAGALLLVVKAIQISRG